MRTADFDYNLPEDLIAAHPAERREDARLLRLLRPDNRLEHRRARDLTAILRAGDLLVVNDTRVIPARLLGRRAPGGGRVEALLVRPIPPSADSETTHEAPRWEALVRPGKRIRVGDRLVFGGDRLEARIVGFGSGNGTRLLEFHWRGEASWDDVLESVGKTPLPPYILRRRQTGEATYPWDDGLTTADDRERYQTVYARQPGSVAAPTAGLHFTPELLAALERGGVERVAVTLHVGPGTFQPVETDDPAAHPIHEEEYEVAPEAAARIERARAEGRRLVGVGTTVARVLEHLAATHGRIEAGRGSTRLLILPGHRFRVLDALLTNFHLPRSTLLMLVSAFAGREFILRAYEEAVRERYRFYSYGDAMLIE